MESAPLDSALVLAASARIFPRPGEPSPANPLTVVGGLSLFQRTMLTLQRGGVSQFVVLAGEETEFLKKQLRDDNRLQVAIRWLPIREFPPGDSRTWESLESFFRGPYLVAGTGGVFPASLVARLCEEGGKGDPVVVVQAEARGDVRERKVIRHEAEGGSGGVLTLETPVVAGVAVDLVAMPGSSTASLTGAGSTDRPFPLQAVLERGLRQGQVRVLPLGADWYQEVCATGDATPERAEWTLLQDGLEGFMRRQFNRPCPQWITRVLLRIIRLLR